jgi:hypothetical protein
VSAVVGIDLSTRALDLVKLDESSNRAEWVRCELEGKTAWERTLQVRDSVIGGSVLRWCQWWDDVYLVAVEAPYGHGSDLLNRVVGAIAASLPARLRAPERCWIVRPDEWKRGLGLKAKPSFTDLVVMTAPDVPDFFDAHTFQNYDQNARDAYCLAMFARDQVQAAA